MKKKEMPIILTATGKSESTGQDAESYQKLLEAKDRMETIKGIKRGLESVKRQRSTLATDFFREFFAENAIPEQE
jgi:hypothetical protein